jgi:uncharacterized protein YecE (DUF72 family)
VGLPALRSGEVSTGQETRITVNPQGEPGRPGTRGLLIGTCGYSFQDWVGPFYPPGTPRGKMFDYYLTRFPTVEINAMYYRILPPSVMAQIGGRAPEGYPIIVKAHKSLTHERHEAWAQLPAWRQSIKPLVERQQMAGVLLQFPYAFRLSEPSLEHLRRAAEELIGHPVFVEFRHASWMRPDVFAFLREHGMHFVSVDEPALPGLLPASPVVTGTTLYVRFHGRNAAHWWGQEGDRYDYHYSSTELTEWREKIKKLQDQVEATYLFFNNCHRGQAASNAQTMQALMEGDSV